MNYEGLEIAVTEIVHGLEKPYTKARKLRVSAYSFSTDHPFEGVEHALIALQNATGDIPLDNHGWPQICREIPWLLSHPVRAGHMQGGSNSLLPQLSPKSYNAMGSPLLAALNPCKHFNGSSTLLSINSKKGDSKSPFSFSDLALTIAKTAPV
ncbi:hypothetical protein KIL84_005049 [Mauremys mutica]|uniref:Uncharacterized protein n=1 Tax=Mauremys mutica TaxID=74926 RepID=A0A9D3XK07_9SAUR|nr:hypothetical protein KIL84_005049 [Mauremys mutica]